MKTMTAVNNGLHFYMNYTLLNPTCNQLYQLVNEAIEGEALIAENRRRNSHYEATGVASSDYRKQNDTSVVHPQRDE